MNNNKKETQNITLLFLLAAGILTTISVTSIPSVIFADKDDDDDDFKEKGEVGEKGEMITKLVANGNDKKLTALASILPEAEAQQQPSLKTENNKTKEGAPQQQQDKGMKLVLGDIVLPIGPQSDFNLELPFSKISVTPVK